MNDTAAESTLHPAKRIKLSHSTDSDLPEEYSARVRVIEHDQFTTALRLVQTQLSASSTIAVTIVKGNVGEFTGLRMVCLDPSKVSLVKAEVVADVDLQEAGSRPTITIRIRDFLDKLRGIPRCSSLLLYVCASGEMLEGLATKGSVRRKFKLPLQSPIAGVEDLESLSCEFDVTISITASSCTSIVTAAKSYESFIGFMLQQARENASARFLTLTFDDEVAGSLSETFLSMVERDVDGDVHRVSSDITCEDALDKFTLKTSVPLTRYPAHKVCPFITKVPQGCAVSFRFNVGAASSGSPQPLFMRYSDGQNTVDCVIAPEVTPSS